MSNSIRMMNMNEFPDIFRLMQLSFPPGEFRTYEEELALINRSEYKVLVNEENGVMQAFISEWILKDTHFIEKFAVNPNVRGKGLGTEILREYLNQIKTSVIIEVEANDTLIARRRNAFYERLGFVQSDIEYEQPLLHKISDRIVLRLMHYPADISNETLYEIKWEVFMTVYSCYDKI